MMNIIIIMYVWYEGNMHGYDSRSKGSIISVACSQHQDRCYSVPHRETERNKAENEIYIHSKTLRYIWNWPTLMRLAELKLPINYDFFFVVDWAYSFNSEKSISLHYYYFSVFLLNFSSFLKTNSIRMFCSILGIICTIFLWNLNKWATFGLNDNSM